MKVEDGGVVLLKVLIEHARHQVWQNRPTEALSILDDAGDAAQKMLDYFRILQQAEASVPLSWTEFVNMRSKKRKQ